MPVWAKLTPSTTDIVVEARGAFLGGADAIVSSNTFPSLPPIDPETLEFEMNVDGLVSSGGLGGPAILPLSMAKMAQLTQAFPDKAFSGIGGIADFSHALNYFLLGCGTVQVCTAAMLDHAIGPNVIKALIAGMRESMERHGWNDARGLPRHPPRSRRHALADPQARREGLSRRLRRGRLRRRDRDALMTRSEVILEDTFDRRQPVSSKNDLDPTFVEVTEDLSASPLWNPDLAPTPLARRTWSTYHIAALWIGMSVVITTYTLASGLMQQGMTWWQAMLTILLGNAIVLLPMILNAHAGTKYGVSFPVLCRASFGVRGREHPRDPARARRLRLVRHPDVDRRARAEHAARRRVAGVGGHCRRHLDLVRDLLGRSRSGSSSTVSKGSRSSRAGRRRCCSAAARCCLDGRSSAAAASVTSSANRCGCRQTHVPFWRLFPAALTANVGYWATLSLNIPGLHALRAKPAIAGARPGARPAGDDDGVRVHRRGGDQRDDRAVRRSDLGSGRAHRAHRQRARHHLRRAHRPARAADDEHGGQRRVAGERLLEPRAAAYQLRHRRADHRGHRHRR